MKLLTTVFGFRKCRRQSPQGFAAKQHQTFLLEPILTPSGIIDGLDDAPAVGDISLLDDFIETDIELDQGSDNADIAPSLEAETATIDLASDTDLEEVAFVTSLSKDFSVSSSFQFESGYFTVGDSGQVTIDYLFDGGKYQGELAVFSLEGMESVAPGSEAFIQEAASRALSDSELGYVVISDKTEGARFSGELGERAWNSGDYRGAQTFEMTAGDRFGLMLVPDGKVSDVASNPGLDGAKAPLFSLATANPDDGLQLGQIADVTGDGNTYVFEDLRVDGKSDQDYNDLIFQIRGAEGQTALVDDLIAPDLEWRDSDLGQGLIQYAKEYINADVTSIETPEDVAVADAAQPLIGIIDTGFSGNNPDIDYDRITLGSDRVDGDTNPLLAAGEGNEHGTHLLGIIAAEQDNGIGIDGVNNAAPIWVGRTIGSGEWADSLVEFVEHYREIDQPNAVVNLSLDLTQVNPDGSVTTRYELTPAERAAIDYARQHEIILVVSAGNDGGVMSALGQASQEFDNIITVGSAERVNAAFSASNAYERADYSSYGQGLDILASGGTAENPVLSTVGDGTGSLAGTSVATAKVTGAISKVWAANPDLNYLQVIDLIKSTATDLQGANWDAETGAGLLNLAAAMTMARATTPEVLTDIPATLIPESWSGEGVITPTERATATPFMGKYYKWGSYTIRSGDTLSSIAQSTLGSGEAAYWNFIYNQNRGTIANPNLVYPGQVIWVPREVAAPTPTPMPAPTPVPPNNSSSLPGIPGQSREYVVRRGDTLWAIAQRELGNGNRWREIMKTRNGGTFTEAEARGLQPKDRVYLPVNYETGSGKPVTSKPDNAPTPSTGKFDISKITQTVPANIRSYAEESIPRILAAAAGAGITNLGQLAYILATSEHESVAGKYMEELASGDAYEGRADLGNTQSGDGRRYKGRGYVQITGRTNYTNWAKRLGVDLVGNPVLASTPAIAAQILVEGMRDGSFTGVGLSRYINGSNRDFYNARRIVNGIDLASKIAEIAKRYYDALVNAVQQNVSPSKNVILRPGSQNLEFSRGKEWRTASNFRFIFQTDGNVVLYNPQGKAVWATGTNGTNADKFVVQTDGNVVLYERSNPVWATNTNGNSGTYFVIQGDGNLVVYSSDGKPLYDSATHSGRTGTFSASAEWIRDRNLRRFPNLQFTTFTSKATSKALDAGGGNSSVYPHPSPNADNTYHQWGFEKVGDYYLIINKATGKVLDAGGSNGTLPYLNSYPDTQNPYQLWKLTQVGDAYLVVNKATGHALDSGGASGNQIYMHPNPMSGNSFHLWELNLPETNMGWQNPLDTSTYTISPGGEYGARDGSHYGIDLSTWHSNPYVSVKAAQSGKVIEVGYHPNGWGHFIKIRHNNEFQTVYAHLSQVDVAEGQTVSGGQKIGNVGSTGNSSGPHLHFETYVAPFRWPTDTINPRTYITF